MPSFLPKRSNFLLILLIIFLQIFLFCTLFGLTVFGFLRETEDRKFYQACVTLQNEYQEDFTKQTLSFSCTNRQWWQFHSKFISPKEEHQNAITLTKKLEEERSAEKKELQSKSTILSNQISRLLQQQEEINFDSFSYYQLVNYVKESQKELDDLVLIFNKKQQEIEKKIKYYPQPSPDFIGYLSHYNQKNAVQKNIDYPEFITKWSAEEKAWSTRLYEAKKNNNQVKSISLPDFQNDFSNFLTFSPTEFVGLGDLKTKDAQNLSRKDISLFEEAAANEYLLKYAQEKGYQFRKIYAGDLVEIEGEKLPPQVSSNFLEMKKAAGKDGILLSLTSGFRDAEAQKQLFLNRFLQNSYSFNGPFLPSQIAKGEANLALEETFKMTAIPGKSKHHSGYAVDIGDESVDSTKIGFIDTPAFAWLKENNFMNAKRFGFVPSYPEGVSQIGPNPEPWEYVWVGKEKLENQD